MFSIESLEDLQERYPNVLKSLFSRLKLKGDSFTEIKKYIRDKDFINAGDLLLTYFSQFSINDRFPIQSPALVQKIGVDPDLVIENKFNFPKGLVSHPIKSNGCLKWEWLGPDNDIEYGYRINRFSWVPALYDAYVKTKDEKYVKYFVKNFLDWNKEHPRPLLKKNNVFWRVLEAGLRLLISWPLIFYGFKDSHSLTPAVKILLLSNVYDQAQYVRYYHAYMGNHLTIEMDGLSTVALCFPEFKSSEKWLKVAAKNIQKELLSRQVYPDGVQKELSAHIHLLTLFHFDHFARNIKYYKKEHLLKKGFFKRVELMWDYLAKCLRPSGDSPFNNDCPFFLRDWFPVIEEMANKFRRDDWRYITSHGLKGKKPEGIASQIFPWAGQVIMRDNWGENSSWGFFDIGQSGISPSHLHRDKLHFSLYAGGRDILIDTGFYHHIRDKWRNTYFNSTFGHNSIVIDNRAQKKEKFQAKKPINSNYYELNNEYDFAVGSYKGKYGRSKIGTRYFMKHTTKEKIRHTRAVFHKRNGYWLLIDKISTKKPRNINVLWHFHPDCTVQIERDSKFLTTDENKGNIAVEPVSNLNWKIKILNGQEKPVIQGWFAPKYGEKVSSPCVICECNIEDSTLFAWFIDCGIDTVESKTIENVDLKVNSLKFEVLSKDSKKETIKIDLSNEKDPQLHVFLKK